MYVEVEDTLVQANDTSSSHMWLCERTFRSRHVNRLIRVGRQEIVAVLRVNKEKGILYIECID